MKMARRLPRRGTAGAAGAALFGLLALATPMAAAPQEDSAPRARELGVPFPGKPGPLNAITDVPGVFVGHTTIVFGEGRLERGEGPARTESRRSCPGGAQEIPCMPVGMRSTATAR